MRLRFPLHAFVAQLAARGSHNPKVAGSIPVESITDLPNSLGGQDTRLSPESPGFNSRLGNFFVFQKKKRLRVPHGFAPKTGFNSRLGNFFVIQKKKKTSCTPWICTKFNSRLGNFFVFQKKRLRVPHGFAPKIIKNNVHSHLQIIYFFYNQNVFISRRKKKGAKGDSNPRPLAPKARIIPLDHRPLLTEMKPGGI